jgi:hypothetical protein
MSTANEAQVLAEHTAETKPHHTDTSEQNDYEKAPGRWNAPQLNLTDARTAAHERIRKANEAKAATPAPTVEESPASDAPISSEALAIARHAGIRALAPLVQRVIDLEQERTQNQ